MLRSCFGLYFIFSKIGLISVERPRKVGELGGGGGGSNKLEPGSLCPMTVRCIDLTGLAENLSDGFRGEAGDTDPPTQNMGPLVFLGHPPIYPVVLSQDYYCKPVHYYYSKPVDYFYYFKPVNESLK
jgi:hypothetical protein